MKSVHTHRLTDDGVFDSVDAAGEHGEGQRRVEAEVQQHVPSLSADANGAARKTHMTNIRTQSREVFCASS